MSSVKKMERGIVTTARVWLKVSNLIWVPGTVEEVTDSQVIISTSDGKHVKLPRGSDRISQRTPKELEAVDNLTDLPDLDEPNLLHSLNVRYSRSQIYTRTGPILVAMNPWTNLPLYGQDVLHSYRKANLNSAAPHIYGIGEAAFSNLQITRKDQAILVSGDSGSGKTESTKFMMQYLASVAHQSHTTQTEQKVLQCNPVLEAFGNAKTRRNDNSSRFGKFIEIQFDEGLALVGAKIDTYLLEKSRVVGQEDGERSFHIFYQLTSQYNADQQLTAHVELQSAESFQYISKGANVAVGHLPATSFNSTLKALDSVGISVAERQEIFKVLSLILHLGNLSFDASANPDEAALPTGDPRAATCARLMGVEAGRFREAFLVRQIQAGSQELGDSYVVAQTPQQAVDSRDALARALYGSLFDALVGRINEALLRARAGKARTISILDIFGFEHFQNNSFEQFCINYANEKLQGYFNEFNFALEIQEYQREGIQWSYDDFKFQTNTKCIELIEGRRTGMLALLDEQCVMPGGGDEAFCTKLKTELGEHPYLNANRMRGTRFTVRHYAAEVTYDAVGFCFKNKDPVLPALVELMSASDSPYIRLLATSRAEARPSARGAAGTRSDPARSTIIFESVTAQFRRQLADLMGRISATQPHFVRCINPNSAKAPGRLEPEMVLDQLRCSGLMEAVRVSRAGFPVRIAHEDFIERFAILVPRPAGDAAAAARQMVVALRVPSADCRLGTSKVFMRREAHERLEEERSRLLVRQIVAIQRTIRGHWARVAVRALRIARRRAALAIEAAVRRSLARQWYRSMLDRRRAISEKTRSVPPPAISGPQLELSKNAPLQPFGGASKLLSTPTPAVAVAGRPPPPPPQTVAQERSPPPREAPPGVVDGLEAQLGSVRVLYYDERDGLLALSGMVKEVCAMSDETVIASSIAAFEAALARQEQGNIPSQGIVAPGTPPANAALVRRADSLRAGVALLKDKWTLVRTAKQAQAYAAQAQAQAAQATAQARAARISETQQAAAAQAAVAQARTAQEQAAQAMMQARAAQAQANAHAQQLAVQAQVAREQAEHFQQRERALLEQIETIQRRLDNARRELNSKDDAIILLNGEIAQLQKGLSNGPGPTFESDLKEMRNRIQDLQVRNEALRLALEQAKRESNAASGPSSADIAALRELETRAVQFDESVIRERKARDAEFEAMDANIRARDEQIRDLTDRCRQLESALKIRPADHGPREAYLADSAKVALIAKQLDGLLSSLDGSELAEGVAKCLHSRMIELSKEEKQRAGQENCPEGSLEMAVALGRLVEAFCSFLTRLLGSDVFVSSAGSVLM